MKKTFVFLASLAVVLGQSTKVLSEEFKLPPIRAGMTYKQVRQILSASGFFPIALHWSQTENYWHFGNEGREYKIFEKGYSDIQSCVPTGYAYCNFIWGDGYGNKLRITTAGQADEEPENLPLNSWTINPLEEELDN